MLKTCNFCSFFLLHFFPVVNFRVWFCRFLFVSPCLWWSESVRLTCFRENMVWDPTVTFVVEIGRKWDWNNSQWHSHFPLGLPLFFASSWAPWAGISVGCCTARENGEGIPTFFLGYVLSTDDNHYGQVLQYLYVAFSSSFFTFKIRTKSTFMSPVGKPLKTTRMTTRHTIHYYQFL